VSSAAISRRRPKPPPAAEPTTTAGVSNFTAAASCDFRVHVLTSGALDPYRIDEQVENVS